MQRWIPLLEERCKPHGVLALVIAQTPLYAPLTGEEPLPGPSNGRKHSALVIDRCIASLMARTERACERVTPTILELLFVIWTKRR